MALFIRSRKVLALAMVLFQVWLGHKNQLQYLLIHQCFCFHLLHFSLQASALLVRTRTRCDAGLLEGSAVRFVGSATIGADHVDVAFNTHPHDDHIVGFQYVPETAAIDRFIITFPEDANFHMQDTLKVMQERTAATV